MGSNRFTVAKRANNYKQPKGGFLSPTVFEKVLLDGGGIEELHLHENVHSSLVGLAVDYLTRYMTGSPLEDAFMISQMGAMRIGAFDVFDDLISMIEGLDDLSIQSAIQLTGFDVVYRQGSSYYKPITDIEPDADTVDNVRIMVQRALHFFEIYGPKTQDDLTFEGAYTSTVTTGDADFLTKDTLWDFKVSKQKLTNKHTLQLLIYWRMGCHAHPSTYKKLKYIGIYNPRLNIVYRYPVEKLPSSIVDVIEKDVIGY